MQYNEMKNTYESASAPYVTTYANLAARQAGEKYLYSYANFLSRGLGTP